MRKRSMWLVTVAAATLALVQMSFTVPAAGSVGGRGADWVAPAGKQLLQARGATSQYRKIRRALDDGYANIDLFVAGQGCHYLNNSLLDGTFDPRRPELLMYAESPGKRPLLLGVEYAVPISLSATAPEGFTGAYDVWTENTEAGLWTLHTWIFLPNPGGVFADNNPLAPQTSSGCGLGPGRNR